MLYPLTQNPNFRVLDAIGRDFASHPPSPPPLFGPKTGQPRSAEEIAVERGFNGLSDMLCRIAEVDRKIPLVQVRVRGALSPDSRVAVDGRRPSTRRRRIAGAWAPSRAACGRASEPSPASPW